MGAEHSVFVGELRGAAVVCTLLVHGRMQWQGCVHPHLQLHTPMRPSSGAGATAPTTSRLSNARISTCRVGCCLVRSSVPPKR